jgi:hypothetical protein
VPNGCEAELAISSWLISILKQIADEKNSSSTISLSTVTRIVPLGHHKLLTMMVLTSVGKVGICMAKLDLICFTEYQSKTRLVQCSTSSTI